MNKQYKELIENIKEAGKIVEGYFGKNLKVTEKATSADLRTKADLESEKYLIKNIQKLFPGYNILSEESGIIDNGSEYTFVVDPLDGTNNFVLGLPAFSISVGLIKNGQIIFGAIYAPILRNLYYAEIGKGAFSNGRRIFVSKENELVRSSISYACGYTNNHIGHGEIIKEIYKLKPKRVLENWSPALDYCLLASGKIEAIINDNNEIYDFAAGKLIAKEAGAVITDFKGDKEKDDKNVRFIISNRKETQARILKIFK